MYREHTIGVVVPAYNEEGFVGDVIREMPEFVDRIYVVDDASTDNTWDKIITAAKEDALASESEPEPIEPGGATIADGGIARVGHGIRHQLIGRVIPMKHETNTGQGGAMKTGYFAALEDEIEIVGKMDGDGQMDPEQLHRLLDPIVEGEADYAKGNRLLYQSYRQDMPSWRLLGNSILTFLTKIASGYWKMMDPQNGYTAISYHALDNIGIENLYEYYGYCNDLLVKLNAKSMRIADVGMPAIYGPEKSSISYPTYIRKVSAMLLRNFLWRLKTRYFVLDFHPLGIFYVFGILMVLIGLLGGMWSIYVRITLGRGLFIRASLSLLIFTIGSMFVMFAMLFDMQANEDRETQIYE